MHTLHSTIILLNIFNTQIYACKIHLTIYIYILQQLFEQHQKYIMYFQFYFVKTVFNSLSICIQQSQYFICISICICCGIEIAIENPNITGIDYLHFGIVTTLKIHYITAIDQIRFNFIFIVQSTTPERIKYSNYPERNKKAYFSN